MPEVLAIDIGTSSVRASIFDAALRLRRLAQITYRLATRPDGRVEIDPYRLERLVMTVVDRALGERRRPVDAVAIATFWHSFMGVDPDNQPLTPLIPWNDRRAEREADELRRSKHERAIHARTGCRLHASYWPARLLWVRRRQPRVFSHVARWVSFGEWLERRWLDRNGVSISQASGSGLLVQDTCVWDAALMAICDVHRESLAPIVDVDDEQAELSPRLRQRWPALAKARWIPAVGDGAANNVGAGCVTPGRAALMIGTSGALRVIWESSPRERVRPPFGLWRYRLDRRRIVVGGALSNGGNVREWVLGTFTGGRQLERKALALEPDAHGLTMLPFLTGTRSPDYLTHATATIAGMTLATRPEHVLRAAMESVGYRFGLVFDTLKTMTEIGEIVAAGGALERSTGWVQILADVLARPIAVCLERELTSRGAAAIALEQIGVADLAAHPPRKGTLVRPDSRRHARYVAAKERQQALTALMFSGRSL